jgi:hypothetical protein
MSRGEAENQFLEIPTDKEVNTTHIQSNRLNSLWIWIRQNTEK